jgi:phytoene dehydrogenase-like protein
MGKIYLHAPVEMKVGDRRGVDAHVGVNVPDEILQGRVRPGEQIKEALLRVSYEMIATLHGPGFKINPTTPEQQTVADGLPTVWEWEIEANQDGAQELEATLYALVPNTVVPTGAPANTRQRIDAYSQTILVSVKAQSWGEWLKSLREEIDAVKAIAIALGGVATAAIAWLGISGSWRRRSPTRPRKSGTRAVKSGGSRS